MERGVSPLIAWVLLVGFAVVMGAFIFSWATQTIKNLNIGESQEFEVYCENVELRINSVCVYVSGEKYIYPNFTNAGNYDITKLTVTLENKKSASEFRPLGSCLILDEDVASFNNQGRPSYGFQVGKDFSFSEASGGSGLTFISLDTIRSGESDGVGGVYDKVTCSYQGYSGRYDFDLSYFAVTPWVKVDKEESFPCNNKEVIIDGRTNNLIFTQLNTECTFGFTP